jgi:hypothetical protein
VPLPVTDSKSEARAKFEARWAEWHALYVESHGYAHGFVRASPLYADPSALAAGIATLQRVESELSRRTAPLCEAIGVLKEELTRGRDALAMHARALAADGESACLTELKRVVAQSDALEPAIDKAARTVAFLTRFKQSQAVQSRLVEDTQKANRVLAKARAEARLFKTTCEGLRSTRRTASYSPPNQRNWRAPNRSAVVCSPTRTHARDCRHCASCSPTSPNCAGTFRISTRSPTRPPLRCRRPRRCPLTMRKSNCCRPALRA